MSLVNQVQLLTERVAAELKAHRVLINGNAADLSALTTTEKSNLVGALNELHALIGAIDTSEVIDDTTVGLATTYSSAKIVDLVATAIDDLVAGAPAALDTLKELADAFTDTENVVASLTLALSNRLRIDADQDLTPAQQAFGRSNLDVFSKAEIGDIDTDFVAIFNAGLT